MRIKTFNEFCIILWYYAPIAYDLHINGELTGTTSKIGTQPLFYFSPDHTEDKLHNWRLKRHGIRKYKSSFYNHDLPEIQGWTPPPYNEHFKNELLIFDKPILTIHNKCTIEWGKGMFNYFDLPSLKMIFKEFYEDHQIIYIRPPQGDTDSFQHDSPNEVQNIGDAELINESYPNIITMENLLESYPDKSYNELQMMSLANSDKHICAAGGEAAIASYFGGDVLIYRHPTAASNTRKVWHTDSYLKRYSGSRILGYDNYESLVGEAKDLWK